MLVSITPTHSALWAGLSFNFLLFLAVLSRKGTNKQTKKHISESLQLPQVFEKQRAEEQAGNLGLLKAPASWRCLYLPVHVQEQQSSNQLDQTLGSVWVCEMDVAYRSALPGLLQDAECVGHPGTFSGVESQRKLLHGGSWLCQQRLLLPTTRLDRYIEKIMPRGNCCGISASGM